MAGKPKIFLSESQLMDFINQAYAKVTGDLPIVGSAVDLAESYRNPKKNTQACVDSLIRWQCSKTAIAGFVTGMGGFMTMPVAIPADFGQCLYVQLRMIAAIAHLYKHDIHSDQVSIMCIACLCGDSAKEILAKAGVKIGQKLAVKLIKSISAETIIAINKAVGFRLLTKFGSRGAINLGKAVPFAGAGIGSALNFVSTYSVGKAAKLVLGNS